MTESLQRRRRLRRVASFYALELLVGPFQSTRVMLGGEEKALRVLEAAWRQVEPNQVYDGCARPWAWWRFTRPDLPYVDDPVGQALALNTAGELSDPEVAAMIAEAERSLDKMDRVAWHGRPHPVVIAEALVTARGLPGLRAYEVRS